MTDKKIKAVVFDLDNTLVDFMAMKRRAIDAAIDAMVDAGLELEPLEIRSRIDAIYKERGIEYQQVFDDLIYNIFQKIDHRVLASGIIAYRRAREAALKPYPHVTATLMKLIRRGVKLDNMVHIGHNDIVGANVVIAAQTGISGSSEIGDGCVIGGQVGAALLTSDTIGRTHVPAESAFVIAFWISAAVALAGALVALRAHERAARGAFAD